MDRAPRRAGRGGATITAYFEFLATGVSLDGTPFLENFFNTDYGVMSIALNIPAMWQEIMMPGENLYRYAGPGSRNTLSPTLLGRLGRMGLIAAEHYGSRRHFTDGPRRYILRPHTLNITIEIYRTFIAPHLITVFNGNQIPNNQVFDRAHDTAQALWSEEIYLEYLVHTERFDRNNPADEAFLRELPDNIRGWFT